MRFGYGTRKQPTFTNFGAFTKTRVVLIVSSKEPTRRQYSLKPVNCRRMGLSPKNLQFDAGVELKVPLSAYIAKSILIGVVSSVPGRLCSDRPGDCVPFWLVSFMDYDLGYIDLEEKTLQPLSNPFGPKVLPMS